MSDDDRPLVYMPSPAVQVFISLIGIPMATLSIIGSYAIIRHARLGKGHSVYRKIMMVSSVCDIIWSGAWILQPYLTDNNRDIQHEDELWIWSFGNSASCTFLGAMTQFGLSAHWYAGLLSFYFVSTVKFRVKQTTWAKMLPFLQGFIILWSVGTACAGAIMNRFHPLGSSPGCWVGGDGFCGDEEDCNITVLLGWIIGGIPTILMLVFVIVNNLILYCHVRSTVMEGQRRAMESQMELSKYSLQISNGKGKNQGQSASTFSEQRQLGDSKEASRTMDSCDMSFASIVENTGEVKALHGRSQKSMISRFGRSSDGSVFSTGRSVLQQKSSVLRSSEKQWKRVQEVGTQSFLYVGAYLLSFGWTFVINFLDSRNFEFKENAANYFLPLLICQALFLPTMGFFNFCVYFRPKVLTIGREFPNESLTWRVRRAVYGNAIKPTPATARLSAQPPGSVVPADPPETLRLNLGGQVAMSSLANGDSEVESNNDNERMDEFEMSNDGCSVIMEGEVEDSSRHMIDGSERPSLSSSKQERGQ